MKFLSPKTRLHQPRVFTMPKNKRCCAAQSPLVVQHDVSYVLFARQFAALLNRRRRLPQALTECGDTPSVSTIRDNGMRVAAFCAEGAIL